MRSLLPLTVAFSCAMLGLAGQAYGQTDEVCIAANEKAVSLGMAGKLLDEGKELASCAAASCPDVVKVSCAQRLVELTAKIPSIVFDVRDASGNSLADVRLSIDGVAFGERLTGTAIPLDPGSHQFTFETAGQPAVTRTLIVQEGERDRRESVTLGTPSPPVPAVASGPSYSSAPPEDSGHGRRVLGLIVGGVGLAGLGVGGIFGGLTFSSWGHANTECPSHSACSTQATNDRSSALTSGTISTVSFIAGGVLLAGGLALYFTAPNDHGPSIGVQLAPGALGVTGRFW